MNKKDCEKLQAIIDSLSNKELVEAMKASLTSLANTNQKYRSALKEFVKIKLKELSKQLRTHPDLNTPRVEDGIIALKTLLRFLNKVEKLKPNPENN
jgi:hypothetical protein